MNYVVLLFIFLYYKLHFFQLAAMLLSAGDDINAGCVNTAVTEQVCQFRNVLFDGVEGAGKELSQVVGKHLSRLHPCSLAKLFHLRPDIAAVQRSTAFRAENQGSDDAHPFCVV